VVGAPDKMNVERLRLMNVAGPEQADIAVLESVAARDALEGEFDDPIVEELIAHTTLQSPVWRRRLVQLGSVVVDDAQLHRRVARLEEDLVVLHGAVVDVLKVQAGVAWHEEIARLLAMFERTETVIAGAMTGQLVIVHGAVVHDHGFERAAAQHDVWLLRHSEARVRVGETGAWRRIIRRGRSAKRVHPGSLCQAEQQCGSRTRRGFHGRTYDLFA